MADSVKVCARFRPQNQVELSENGQCCVDISGDQVKLLDDGGDKGGHRATPREQPPSQP